MDDSRATPKRGIQLIAAAVVFIAALFLNLDGYHIGPTGMAACRFQAEPPDINWTYGWPWDFLVRSSIYSIAAGKDAPMPSSFRGDDMGITSRWPWDGAPINYFRPLPLIGNIFVVAFVTLGIFIGVGQLPDCLRPAMQFSLKSLLAITTIIAIVLGLNRSAYIPRYVPEFIAIATMVLATIAMFIVIVVFLSRVPTRNQRT